MPPMVSACIDPDQHGCPWCLADERGAGYCAPWLPYPCHDWINRHGGFYEVRCRPDGREVLAPHWPRCVTNIA